MALTHWIIGVAVLLSCLSVQGEEKCESGKYGDGCSQNCSKNCKAFSNNIVRCRKVDGECFDGCKVGVYGKLCDHTCSRNCKNQTCHQETGHCTWGCVANHIGDFCEISQDTAIVQGTTSSSHTTARTGVASRSSLQVIIPVVVSVLVVAVVVVVAVIIFRRCKRRQNSSSPGHDEEAERLPLREPGLDKVEEEGSRQDGSGKERSGVEDDVREEDSGCPTMKLADIKTALGMLRLTMVVTVVERNETEVRNGKEQFMGVVADDTSAVDICVTNRELFDKFEVNSGLVLENVSWNGNVIFLNEKSKVTCTGQAAFDPSVVKEAFGQGEAVSIQEALVLKPKSWFALKGKVVKQSDLTTKDPFGKLLTHRQIKLTDKTGSVFVDVWGDEAVNIQSGDVIHMTGCKRKKSESVGKSAVTTTRKTLVKKLKETEFGDVNIDPGFATCLTEETEVDICAACPEPDSSSPGHNEEAERLPLHAQDPKEEKEGSRQGNISSVNPFDILQTQCVYLTKTLQLKGTCLIDYLFEMKVLTVTQREDIADISRSSEKITHLVSLLMKRPAEDFEHFMKGLEMDQNHIRVYLQDCLEKDARDLKDVEEGSRQGGRISPKQPGRERTKFPRNRNDGSGNVGSGIEDDVREEDSGCPMMKLADIKTASNIPRLAVVVTVVERNETEERYGKEQFMGVVADDTSAVDICVRNRELFDKFEVKSRLVLENVIWSGNVIFLNEKSKVTSTGQTDQIPSVVEEAFGQGEAVSIQEALALKPKSWFSIKGKVVKQSDLTKKDSFGKVLPHRQIKLRDRTGSVFVDVWGDEAINIESGEVIHMTGCKRKKSESVGKSAVTTTRKTLVKKLKEKEFDDINMD